MHLSIINTKLKFKLSNHNIFSPKTVGTYFLNWYFFSECERKIGRESFKSAYSFLKQARFGDQRSMGDTTLDEGEIMKGLKKYVKNPSDCFLIDQLLFLEEQASFDR